MSMDNTIYNTRSNQRLGSAFEIHMKGVKKTSQMLCWLEVLNRLLHHIISMELSDIFSKDSKWTNHIADWLFRFWKQQVSAKKGSPAVARSRLSPVYSRPLVIMTYLLEVIKD